MRGWRMAALNISPAQVRTALGRNNFLSALGTTKGALVQVNLTANTDLHTVEDFKNLVVRQEGGTLVRLGDIADVVLGAEDYNAEVRFSGQRAVFMGVFVLPNANAGRCPRRHAVHRQLVLSRGGGPRLFLARSLDQASGRHGGTVRRFA